jgi:hypothetical protein
MYLMSDCSGEQTVICNTNRYLMVAKVRVRLAVSMFTMHGFHMEKFNLKKLNDAEGKEQYRVEVLNRFTSLDFTQRGSRIL